MNPQNNSQQCLRFYKDESLNKTQLERMNELWNLFRDDNPKWISRQECMNLKSADGFIFVFASFEGPVFEHVRSSFNNIKIISAYCMLWSLKNNKKLPRTNIPIYSFSMSDLNICCTNIEKSLRQKIYDKVEMMRGKTSKIFTESVTHLVTTEVGSAKYHAAALMQIPVMLPDWVMKVWEISSDEYIHATDSQFFKYKCPIFNNFIITASGFNETEKNEIKSLVEANGGVYTGEMVCGTTTHLIINEPKGIKYCHAVQWKMQVVKPAWIHESIKKNYCVSESEYRVTGGESLGSSFSGDQISATRDQTTSFRGTPPVSSFTKQRSKMVPPDMDISIINKNAENKLLNLTGSSNNITIMQPANVSIMNSTAIIPTSASLKYSSNILKELNSISKIKLTLFDGINLFFETFDEPGVNEKLKKLSDSGGATRYDSASSDVSHVIVNILNEKQCKLYLDLNPEMNIVNIDWFIDSCKENQLMECKPYFVYNNALNSVKTPKKRARAEKPNQLESIPKNNLTDSDLNDCLSQYLNAETAALMKNKNQENKIKFDCIQNEIFSNKKFKIIGFEDIETASLSNVLKKHGAIIIDEENDCQTSIDFTICPICPRIEDNLYEIEDNSLPVTVYWLFDCIEKKSLIDDFTNNLFYQPIPRSEIIENPLADCVITISGFGKAEKDTFTSLASMLGAYVQSQLSYQDTDTIKKNTHLISKTESGPKYNGAIKWGLPVISPDWLIEACITGKKPDEKNFSITNNEKNSEYKTFLIKRVNEMKNKIRANKSINNSNRTIDKVNLTNSILQQTHHDSFVTTIIDNQNDLSLTTSNESKKRKIIESNSPKCQPPETTMKTQYLNFEEINNYLINEDKETNLITNQDHSQNKLKEATDTFYEDQLLMAAINNKSNVVKVAPLINHNPRLRELKQEQVYASPKASQPFYINETPEWIKPPNQQSKIADYRLKCFDDVQFNTPEILKDIKKQQNAAADNTPTPIAFGRAIQQLNENSKKQSFYTGYEKSPPISFSLDQKVDDGGHYLEKENKKPVEITNNLVNKKNTEIIHIPNEPVTNDIVSEETETENEIQPPHQNMPDSLDIKMHLLDQLQDKLSSMRNTSNNSSNAVASNSNNSNQNDTDLLMINELNNYDKRNEHAIENNDTGEEDDDFDVENQLRNINLYKRKYAAGKYGLTKSAVDREADDFSNQNNIPISSQIQMTIWKDDTQHCQTVSSKTIANSTRATRSATNLKGKQSK